MAAIRVEHTGEQSEITRLTISHPDRRNALTWEMYEQLYAACEEADARGARVVVLRGDPAAGGAFAAGTDIRHFAAFADGKADGEEGLACEQRMSRVLNRVLALRAPLVGVVEGPAVGGGLALAAACDLLLATPAARFGVPIARTLGNCLPASVIARLKDRLGGARAMALLLTGELLSAEAARDAGFVYRLVSPGGLEDELAALTERLRGCAPLTLAALKETDRRLTAAAAATDTDDLLRACYGSADFREGVRAFLGHRAPRWQGR